MRATYAGFFFKGDYLHFDAADRNTFSFLKRKEEKKKQTEKVCQFSGSRSRGIRVSLYMTDLSDKQASWKQKQNKTKETSKGGGGVFVPHTNTPPPPAAVAPVHGIPLIYSAAVIDRRLHCCVCLFLTDIYWN